MISVVIPTYQRPQLLKRSLGSVLAQTVRDLEVIVVDDGSREHAAVQQVISAFSDDRVRLITHDRNRGVAAARNSGIQMARGSFIAFLDDDDEWLPDKLEKQLQVFDSSPYPDLGVVYCGYKHVGTDAIAPHDVEPLFRGDVSGHMLRSCIMGSATPLIRKELLDRTGYFDTKLPSCNDWDLWIRLSAICSFDFVPSSLANAYVHGRQISGSLDKKIAGRITIVDKYALRLDQHPAILALHCERIGLLLMLQGHRAEAIAWFRRAIRADRYRHRTYLHLLLASLFPWLHRSLITRYGLFTYAGVRFYY